MGRIVPLMKNLPPNLRVLKLDLKKMDLLNDTIAALSTKLPRELESLTIDFGFNEQIDNWGLTDFVNKLPPKVTSLHLELGGTNVDKEFASKQHSLKGLQEQIKKDAEKGNLCITFSML